VFGGFTRALLAQSDLAGPVQPLIFSQASALQGWRGRLQAEHEEGVVGGEEKPTDQGSAPEVGTAGDRGPAPVPKAMIAG
jgi:hypothetical protein